MTAFRIGGTLLALTIAHGASAWDRVSSFSPELAVDFPPAAMTTPDAHGFWAAGTMDGFTVLVHYDDAGTLQFVRHLKNAQGNAVVGVIAMPDGGASVYDTEGFPYTFCTLRRYDAAGNLRWTSDALNPPQPFFSNSPCPPLRVDGTAGIWTRGASTLARIGADGAVQATVTLDGLSVEDIVADPAGSSVYAIGAVGGYDSGLAAVEKIDGHGVLQWKMQAPATLGHSDFTAAAAHSGGIYAFGTIDVDGPHEALYGVHLTSTGQLAWQNAATGIAAREVDTAAVGVDGSGLVLFESGEDATDRAQLLAKTGAAGAFAWQAIVRGTECFVDLLRVAPNGDAVVDDTLCPGDGSVEQANEDITNLIRFAPDGTRVAGATYTGVFAADLQLLPDSSGLLLDQFDPQTPPSFDRRGRDGAALTPPQTARIVTALHDSYDTALASDGSVYLLDNAADGTRYSFSRLAPDGHVLWTQQANGSWSDDAYQSTIVLAGGAACLVGRRDGREVVDCHSAETGGPLGAAALDESNGFVANSFARALDNGQILVFYDDHTEGKAHETLLSTSGAVLHDATPLLPGEYRNAVSSNGAGLSLLATSGSNFVELAADGTRRYSHTATALGAITQTYLLDDGTGLLLSMNGTAPQLSRLDGNGDIVWTKAVSQPPPSPSQPYNHASTIVIHGSDAYVALGFDGLALVTEDTPLRHAPYLIERLSLADGGVTWSRLIDGVQFEFPLAQLDKASQRLVVVSGWPDKLHTQVLDAGTGSVLDDRFDACDATNCALLRADIGSDNALRVIAAAADETNGRVERIFQRNGPFGPASVIRIDQAGLDGAWFAPYAAGQGFSLDYIASAKTLFMPWFTYSADGGSTPAALAWYALQGSVEAGATGTDLAITAADPGSFNAGAVGVHQVGSAHLSFSDCSSGTLSYRFNADVNAGASGLISLTRLTPPSDVCVLADGSTAPAQVTGTTVQGFASSQSGSWFDPATAGQGLEITIAPASAGNDGFVFAAWFTFDPANESDDAAHQHWFTLQGSLASANAGKVTLPILRTIGGSLDAVPTGDTVQVGHAVLTIKSCDSAQLDYQFDDSDVVHAFAGLSGSIALAKIGGCAAQ